MPPQLIERTHLIRFLPIEKKKRVGALLCYSIHPQGRIRIDITHQHPLCIIE